MYLGQDEPAAEKPTIDYKAILDAHTQALERIEKVSEEQLLFRKVATFAAVAGALFAMLRLSEIYIAIQDRKQRHV